MVDFPSNNAANPASKPTKGVDTQPAAQAKLAVTETVKAVITTVEARAADRYEVVLRVVAGSGSSATAQAALSQGPASGQTPVSQITPEVMQALRQGQAVLIKTESQFPLPVAARLTATVSPRQGILIQSVTPPPAPELTANLIKVLVPQQQGAAALLSNLLVLRQQPELLRLLPNTVRNAVEQLLQQLPKPADLQQAGPLKSTVENSGIFREAKLAALVTQLKQLQTPTGPGTPDSRAVDNSSSLSKQILAFSQRILEAAGRGKTQGSEEVARPTPNQVATKPAAGNAASNTSTQNTAAEAKQAATTAIIQQLQQATGQDIKQLLQNIQQALQNAAQGNAKAPEAPTAGKGANPNAPVANTGAGKATPEGTPPGTQGKPDAILAARAGEATSTTRTATANSAIHQYTKGPGSEASTSGPVSNRPVGMASPEMLLLPPLPGHIQVQPQSRERPTIKGNEMADGLASIVLKQAKGTLARMNLHQLASQSRTQDAGGQPLVLSFEIPVVQGQQSHIFQFRIEEEEGNEQTQEGSTAKQWKVQLGFDIEGLGPMLCQIQLCGHSTSVSFWAEWEHTLDATKAHFDYLETVLEDMGLKVNKLQGHLGIPKVDKTLLQQQLVDVKT